MKPELFVEVFVIDDDDAEALPKLNPELPFEELSFFSSLPPALDSAVEVEAAGAPKLNPFEDGFVLAGVVPKENPVPVALVSSFFSFFGGVSLGLVSGVGNEAVGLLPNENPLAPMLPADDAAGARAAVTVGAPKENPPVPILALVLVAAPLSPPEGVASDLLASPSLGLSHDKQMVSDFGFWDVHTEHFHCVI